MIILPTSLMSLISPPTLLRRLLYHKFNHYYSRQFFKCTCQFCCFPILLPSTCNLLLFLDFLYDFPPTNIYNRESFFFLTLYFKRYIYPRVRKKKFIETMKLNSINHTTFLRCVYRASVNNISFSE